MTRAVFCIGGGVGGVKIWLTKYIQCSGADVNLRDNDGDTPLHLALGGRRQTGGNDPVCYCVFLIKTSKHASNGEKNSLIIVNVHGFLQQPTRFTNNSIVFSFL